ncbi:MAG TPA: dienelactone hydrolase family protein, partial [Nocardioides sp.]|nr:dienelactone hydrolase family protein [Nocardioides sp.]
QEWWGLNDQIRGVADRFALAGYRALVPDLYRGQSTVEAEEAHHLMSNLNFADAASQDVRGAVQALKARGCPKVGVTGYCMGARLAVRTAGRFPGTVGAVGGFHGGGLVTDADDSPHLAIAGSTAEYVFGNADQDRSMTLDQVAQLEETLQAAERPHLNEIYEGAAHGYTMADTSMYDEAGAERHFKELEALLSRTLR